MLLQALAGLAHERDGLGEDRGHDRAELLGLLLGGALDIGAVHRRDGQIDRQLDRVVGPGEPLRALHLLGEFAEPALKLIRVAEHSAKAASFHARNGSRPAYTGAVAGSNPNPRVRGGIELTLRLVGPVLDLMLA